MPYAPEKPADTSLVKTLALFSRIGQLPSTSDTCEQDVVFTDLSATVPVGGCRVEHLAISGFGTCKDFVSSFLLTDANRSLTSLQVQSHRTRDLRATGRLLARANSRMKAIKIEISWLIRGYFQPDSPRDRCAAGEFITRCWRYS